MTSIASTDSNAASTDASTTDGTLPEPSWPGKVEFVLVWVLAPAVWMVMLGWFLVRLLGGSMNFVVGVAAGVAGVLWLAFCWTKYRRDAAARASRWNGLKYSLPVRWSAVGLLLVAAIVIVVATWPGPATGGDVKFKSVTDAEVAAARKDLDTPYKDDDTTRVKRGNAGFVLDARQEEDGGKGGGGTGGAGSGAGGGNAGTIILVFGTPPAGNPPPNNPAPNNPPPAIPVYIPEGHRGDAQRTEIIKKSKGFGPEWFALGPFAVPAFAMMNVLGIGGSTEYRRVTMETMSQALEGKDLDPKTRAAMVTELAKLTPAQISAWSAAAKKAINEAKDVDEQRKLKAKELVDALASEAGKQASSAAELEAQATAIADNIAKAAKGGPLKADGIRVVVEQSRQNPPPALRNKIREKLAAQADWEAKIKAAWEGYELLAGGSS